MYQQETIKPYNNGDKATQVEQMFDNIAPTYDALNHRLSWDIDRSWRKKAIKQLAPYRPQAILDIATGTGDFAILAADMLKPARLVGADISEGMMEIGRKKVEQRGLQQIISFEKEDCLHLSYADRTFDAVTAAFGIRNLASEFSHETTLSHLLTHSTASLRTTDFQRHCRLFVSHTNHRSFPTRRTDGGDSEERRVP